MIPHNYNNIQINQLEEDTVIAGRLIPKGYVNATQMCKANKKKLKDYLRNKYTFSFFHALTEAENKLGKGGEIVPPDNHKAFSGSKEFGTASGLLIETTNAIGGNADVWCSYNVAMNLAQWVSPAFAAWAAVVLSAVLQGKFEALTEEAKEAQVELRKNWEQIRLQGKVARRGLTDAIKELYERIPGATSCPYYQTFPRVHKAVYVALWGMTAIEIEEALNCPRNTLRDYLPANCLQNFLRDYRPATYLHNLERAEANVMDFIDEDNLNPYKGLCLQAENQDTE